MASMSIWRGHLRLALVSCPMALFNTRHDPMYFDASYYAPDGKAGEDVYAVIRAAIAKTNKVALTRVVISQGDRVVALGLWALA